MISVRIHHGTTLAFSCCPGGRGARAMGRRLKETLAALGKGELVLAVLVLCAACLMILPVPSPLLDLLLTLNIAAAVVVLLLALNVEESLSLSVFPSLLLATTLFRLSMNVSTTRLILLQADAGRVVESFGNFVVGGNPLVGGVLFAILTVVQFVVIAKGAERVAEVAARFTLDAMPGKQMSIDADLRAGAIDQAEAGRRRAGLETESQFYGAMDGAMKFVKGDAVAGILITLVDILGGIAVGTLKRGLDISQALTRYTTLTVGDGLVSQIPALLISTSAGMLVTRVRSEGRGSLPGRQLVGQLAMHPQVMMLAGAVLALLALVPGLPALAFGVLGCTLAAGGFLLARSEANRKRETPSGSRRGTFWLEVPATRLDAGVDAGGKLDAVRRRLSEELGVPVPPVELRRLEGAARWTLWQEGIPLASGRTEGVSPEQALELGLRLAAARLLGVQETQEMLDRLERSQPALVREVVPRLVPPVLLAEVLARLVEEEIPVQNLRAILSALAEWARVEADSASLAERVRVTLAPLISRLVAPDGVLRALLLAPDVDRLIEQGLHKTESGITLALEPEQADAVAKAVAGSSASLGRGEPVLLTRPEIRRPLWRLLRSAGQRARVVSFLELDSSTEVIPAGKITLAS